MSGQTLVVSYWILFTQNVEISLVITLLINLRKGKFTQRCLRVMSYGVQKEKLVTGANINVKVRNNCKLNTSDALPFFRTDSWYDNFISQILVNLVLETRLINGNLWVL